MFKACCRVGLVVSILAMLVGCVSPEDFEALKKQVQTVDSQAGKNAQGVSALTTTTDETNKSLDRFQKKTAGDLKDTNAKIGKTASGLSDRVDNADKALATHEGKLAKLDKGHEALTANVAVLSTSYSKLNQALDALSIANQAEFKKLHDKDKELMTSLAADIGTLRKGLAALKDSLVALENEVKRLAMAREQDVKALTQKHEGLAQVVGGIRESSNKIYSAILQNLRIQRELAADNVSKLKVVIDILEKVLAPAEAAPPATEAPPAAEEKKPAPATEEKPKPAAAAEAPKAEEAE